MILSIILNLKIFDNVFQQYQIWVIWIDWDALMMPAGFGGIGYMAGLGLKHVINDLDLGDDRYKGFKRQKSYIIESDWEINTENGGLKLISKEKKKNMGKIIKFVLKKFVTSGSFMGISFPVFAMKPESILETYAKSISAAPLFFDKIQSDPCERLKKFVSFTFTFSKLFADMDKPFNPVLGQTFQTKIAGGLFTAEQTSHHPPQSSFHFQGNGYVLYATLELGADIGVNSAHGLFLGDIWVRFEDGGVVFGRVLAGEMGGFVVGENKFRPSGSSYAYDPKNKIICSYKRQTKDYFKGQIGLLKQKYQQKLTQILKSQDRFTKFQSFKDKDYECILSNMTACWTKHVSFNHKPYITFDDPKWLPFEPTNTGLKLLPSDSSFRKDIQLRKGNFMKESQEEKEKLEKLERFYRKLRAGDVGVKMEEIQDGEKMEDGDGDGKEDD